MNFESFEDIKVLMDNFDPASLLPDLSTLAGTVATLTRLAVLIGPVVLLVMGILYFFAAPKEANYIFGYRCYFGMGSEEAWRFTQRLAGIVWGLLGLGLTIWAVLVTNKYPDMNAMEMAYNAVSMILLQIGLAFGSCIIMNIVLFVMFDMKGRRRFRNREKE
jgi:uncharacterized membrane protein